MEIWFTLEKKLWNYFENYRTLIDKKCYFIKVYEI